ncbi:MAG: transposase [Pseudomonadales bacterium]|nr:transposase [Pseudomonadales bacterium]
METLCRFESGPGYHFYCVKTDGYGHPAHQEHPRSNFNRYLGIPWGSSGLKKSPRTVRYDWLGQYLFSSIAEVQEYATRWLWTYNHERPNMALGGITPKQKLALVA